MLEVIGYGWKGLAELSKRLNELYPAKEVGVRLGKKKEYRLVPSTPSKARQSWRIMKGSLVLEEFDAFDDDETVEIDYL